MSTEISLIVVGEKENHFKNLMADLDDIHYYPDLEIERFDFDRSTDFHDYLNDKYSKRNPCHWPCNLGKLIDVVKGLESDLEHIEKGGTLEDILDLCWLERDQNYDLILTGIKDLIQKLNDIEDKESQHIILYWF